MKTFVVKFDHRSDGGPRLIGPFNHKNEAQMWLDYQHGFDFEAYVAQMFSPEHGVD